MKRARDCDRGFTLVEMLIALSLTGMIAVMILASLQASSRLWSRLSVSTAAAEEMSFAHGFLRRAIGGAYPRLEPNGSGDVDFSGDATTLEFLGPIISGVSIAGRARITLAVRKEGESEALLLTLSNDHVAGGEPTQETLIADARRIRFSYRARGSEEWLEDWRSRPALPALIRVDVEVSGGRPDWPLLIIRPSIDADVDCRLDTITGGCQGRRS
jgi:general secretion pathway protein J